MYRNTSRDRHRVDGPTDFANRYGEDIQLAGALGCSAFRFLSPGHASNRPPDGSTMPLLSTTGA